MKALLPFPQSIVVLRGEVSSLRWHGFLPLVAESREAFKSGGTDEFPFAVEND
jgi:hypothetical protein